MSDPRSTHDRPGGSGIAEDLVGDGPDMSEMVKLVVDAHLDDEQAQHHTEKIMALDLDTFTLTLPCGTVVIKVCRND